MTKRLFILLITLGVFTLTFLDAQSIQAAATQQEIPGDLPVEDWESRQPGFCRNFDQTRPCCTIDEDNLSSSMMSILIEAIADQSSLTVDDIEAQIMDGISIYEIAINSGLSSEVFQELHTKIREQIWQERRGENGIWVYSPFSKLGKMNRIFGQLFNSENWYQKERGFGSCHQ